MHDVNFERTILLVDDFFRRVERPFAVVGAFGLQAYGLTRATQDLDFAVESTVQEELIDYLASFGYETLHRSSGYSNHLNADSELGRLDFVYVAGETARLLFASARQTLGIGRIRVSVPSPEHLVAMKVHAIKNDPSRTFRELADIQFLVSLPDVDQEQIRTYFERAGLLERYDELRKFLSGS
jgi:hypothetical protein